MDYRAAFEQGVELWNSLPGSKITGEWKVRYCDCKTIEKLIRMRDGVFVDYLCGYPLQAGRTVPKATKVVPFTYPLSS